MISDPNPLHSILALELPILRDSLAVKTPQPTYIQ